MSENADNVPKCQVIVTPPDEGGTHIEEKKVQGHLPQSHKATEFTDSQHEEWAADPMRQILVSKLESLVADNKGDDRYQKMLDIYNRSTVPHPDYIISLLESLPKKDAEPFFRQIDDALEEAAKQTEEPVQKADELMARTDDLSQHRTGSLGDTASDLPLRTKE